MVNTMEHAVEDPPSGEAAADALALAKNVIFMVPDGFGNVAAEAYRIFKGSDPVWEGGFQALVQTHSANSAVTDSAAAATAYATGVKTSNGAVGVDENGVPLVTILELAFNAGKATGIVSTDAIAGATPAAFTASNVDRDNRDEIAQDYIDRKQLTVILGGGREDFLADPDGDWATTLQEAQAAGFDYVTTADGLAAATGERLLGLFGYGPLGLPIGDRSTEPTLAEMTDAALDRLGKDDDGFFLVVEASATDTWAHAHDAASVMRSAQEYEDALQLALDYAAENPGTLVVSVADHETGGMQLATEGERAPALFQNYQATYAEMVVKVLEGVADVGFQLSTRPYVRSVQETVSDLTDGSVQLTRSEIFSLLGASSVEDAYFEFSEVLNARGGVEYTTTGHTDADVSLYAFGPGAAYLEGLVDNTEIAPWLASAMGLSLPAQQEVADASLPADGATELIEVDSLM